MEQSDKATGGATGEAAAPAPSGQGAVMWCASEVLA